MRDESLKRLKVDLTQMVRVSPTVSLSKRSGTLLLKLDHLISFFEKLVWDTSMGY